MGAFFNSNSEVERAFSVETDIHRDPKRNRMNQLMLDAHMNVRYGVESELSYNKNECAQCNSSRKRSHCHCSKAEINEEMLTLYNEAYKMTQEEERVTVLITEESIEILEASENSRLASLKEKLVTRNSFYDDHTMMPVYEQEESKKKGKKKNDQTKVSSESAGKDIGTEKNKSTAVNQKNPGFRIPKRSEAKTKFRKFELSTPGMTSQEHKTGYKWDHDNFGRNSSEKFIFSVWSNIGTSNSLVKSTFRNFEVLTPGMTSQWHKTG